MLKVAVGNAIDDKVLNEGRGVIDFNQVTFAV